MLVNRHFRNQQGNGLLSTGLAKIIQRQTWSLAGMHRRIAHHVRKRESAFPVAAIRCSEKRKQRSVLADGQQLSVAHRPAFGREVEWKNSDFSNKRISHVSLLLLVLRWENSLQRDDEVERQIRLRIVWGWLPPTLLTALGCIALL